MNQYKKELAQDYFERHAGNTECFITSDNRVFHTQGSAASYANTLKDDAVDKFTRGEETPVFDDLEEEDEQENQFSEEDILNFDTTKSEYPEIKKLFTALNLEAPTQKKQDLVEAIEKEKLRILNEKNQ
ncbi:MULTISPECIES: hypothetical protein [Flavobacterium]|uniref:hypothetical protein n=1 Tax=Flavobacterium TaxID=237 RepID=UPI000F4DAC9C|nr:MULTISPECIES: hypothetical protein [Flavobacterium]